ncbi:MAG: hypothetical protein M1834_000732 [Cirrosporium novae-zelandiae]|nr:MAG: hypothetical protein M1834_000732 [Cirrosporium novae-zelandiae]
MHRFFKRYTKESTKPSSITSPPPINFLTHPNRLNNSGQQSLVGPASSFVNAIYYPNWHIYKQRPPSSLNLQFITHIFYAFAWVKLDGTVYLSDEYADTQIPLAGGTRGCLRALFDLKLQYPHLKLILSIGGGGAGSQNFPSAASTKECRARFVESAKTFCNEYGFDGIDIDWETPSELETATSYLQLIKCLQPHFSILTSALPAGTWALQNLPLLEIIPLLTFLNLMTYDFSGPWTSLSGHHAQLFSPSQPHSADAKLSCASAIEYLISRDVPANKILMGIPCYGRSFLGVTGPGQRYTGHGGDEGTFEMRDLPLLNSWEQIDPEVCATICVSPESGWVSYDSPETVSRKAKWARENGIGGLFYWTGSGDRDAGQGSLVEAGWRAYRTP